MLAVGDIIFPILDQVKHNFLPLLLGGPNGGLILVKEVFTAKKLEELVEKTGYQVRTIETIDPSGESRQSHICRAVCRMEKAMAPAPGK